MNLVSSSRHNCWSAKGAKHVSPARKRWDPHNPRHKHQRCRRHSQIHIDQTPLPRDAPRSNSHHLALHLLVTKNNSLPPHSAYNKVMRTRKRRLLSRVSSLLVVLCLLAAPLCATRCTFSSCDKADAHEQSTTVCHHQSKHSHNTSVLAGAIALTCLPADSLLTTLPAEQSRLLSPDSDSHWLSTISNSPSVSEASVLIAFRISNRGSSPGDSASLLANNPLRL